MIDRRGCIVLAPDIGVAQEWSERIGRKESASDVEVYCWRTRCRYSPAIETGDRNAAWGCPIGAVCRPHYLMVHEIRILAGRDGVQLIQIVATSEVCPLTPNIRDDCHEVLRELVLYIQVKLLDVRPNLFLRNGDDTLRKLRAQCATDSGVSRTHNVAGGIKCSTDIALHRIEHQRWGAFQRGGNGFIAISMLPEYPVPAPNGGCAFSGGIVGKADARSGVK